MRRMTGFLLAYVFLALVSVFVSPPKIVAVFSTVALIGVVVSSRTGFLYILLAGAAFEWSLRTGEYNSILYHSIYSSVLLLAFAVIYFRDGHFSHPPREILVPFLLTVGWMAFGVPLSEDFGVSMTALIFFILAALEYFVAYHIIDSRKALRKALIIQLAVSLVFVIYGLSIYYMHGLSRFTLEAFNPNVIGVYVFAACAVALFSITYFKSRILKLLGFIQLSGLVYCLYLTYSRGSLLTFFIFAAVFLWLAGRKKIVFAAVGAMAVIGMIVFSLEHVSTLIHKFSLALRLGSGLTARDVLWQSALGIVLDHPVFGIGFGAIKTVFAETVRMTDPRIALYLHTPVMAGNVHNGFLDIAAQFGLPGLALALWTSVVGLRYVLRIRRNRRDNETRQLTAFLLAAFVAFLVRGFFESYIPLGFFVIDALLGFFVAGALHVLVRAEKETSAVPVEVTDKA